MSINDEWSIMYPAHWEQLRLPTQFTHEEAANLFWCGETRALIWLEDPLSSSLTKLLAEGFRALLVGLSITW